MQQVRPFSFYSKSSFAVLKLSLITSIVSILFPEFFANKSCCLPFQIRTFDPPTTTSIVTWMGYLSTENILTWASGKMDWMQDRAVSRSCSPPSQFRQKRRMKLGVVVVDMVVGFSFEWMEGESSEMVR
eukprot:54234_1